jgi:hypothetical protein
MFVVSAGGRHPLDYFVQFKPKTCATQDVFRGRG